LTLAQNIRVTFFSQRDVGDFGLAPSYKLRQLRVPYSVSLHIAPVGAENSAMIASLFETCKLDGVDQCWLKSRGTTFGPCDMAHLHQQAPNDPPIGLNF
jgi:hypothetical protein